MSRTPMTARCGACSRSCPYCRPRRAAEGRDWSLGRCHTCGLVVPLVHLSHHFAECHLADLVQDRDAVTRMIGEGCPNG